jgi:hypothetical protein
MKSAARAREMAYPMLSNEIATKPSPAAEIESRRCNPMMQNLASGVQRPGSKICVQVIPTNVCNIYIIYLVYSNDLTGTLA